MNWASNLIWRVRLISDWIDPALICLVAHEGVGFVSNSFDRRLSCLAVFTPVERLLLCTWRLSRGEQQKGSMEGIPRDITDEALLFLEL